MSAIPVTMPRLARGKHRNPRRGACFMELASYLAGEPWSDRPTCTDPFLAHAARLINDHTSDAARPQLALLVPSVIGINDLGAGFADEVALMAAVAALPIAAQHSQRALGVGMLQILGDTGRYRSEARSPWPGRARAALAEQPALQAWASSFGRRFGNQPRGFSASTPVTELATQAIARACVSDPDRRLRQVLISAISWAQECSGVDTSHTAELQPDDWAQILQPA